MGGGKKKNSSDGKYTSDMAKDGRDDKIKWRDRVTGEFIMK